MAHSFPAADVRSLWQATAEPRPQFATLGGDQRYDVAIIGGGYTGLTTARHLAAKGLSPIVLEASRIGWGASGRNGGVVEGKFRLSLETIAGRFGLDMARRMQAIGREAVANVAELIDAFKIAAAGYMPNGNMHCAHTPQALAKLRAQAEWEQRSLGEDARMLSADDVAGELGSRAFCGGVLSRHGGTIHPLNFALGLARGLQAAGIAIVEGAPVVALKRDGRDVILETPSGSVRAPQIVLATNGYSDLTPATGAVRRKIVPFRSAMIATAPLPTAIGLAPGRSYSETRRMMRWFRMSGDRLMYGGRGAFGKTDSEAAFRALETAMRRQFPEIGDVPVAYRWSGLVALTLDSVPHLGRLDAQTTYAMGYNGLGVATSTLIGKYVAEVVTGAKPDLGLLTASPLKTIPLYPLRAPAVRCVAGWYQLLDALGR